jgi:outer membrane murein-binding lipoprotein Lpp
MDLDLIVTTVAMFLVFSLLLGTLLIAGSINENANIQKLAIENRCEFNTQKDVWTNCKGPVTQEIK